MKFYKDEPLNLNRFVSNCALRRNKVFILRIVVCVYICVCVYGYFKYFSRFSHTHLLCITKFKDKCSTFNITLLKYVQLTCRGAFSYGHVSRFYLWKNWRIRCIIKNAISVPMCKFFKKKRGNSIYVSFIYLSHTYV